MKRYLLIVIAIILFFLLLFFIVESLGIPLLSDPTIWLKKGGLPAACLGVGLLIADVLLPVPSSLVMVAHGAIFGVVAGTFLSLIGSLGAALFGFAIGRRGGRLMQRIVPVEERTRANYLLERWGTLAIIVTRPVPVLAETMTIVAGASSLSWSKLVLASTFGSLTPAFLYALTGAAVVNFKITALMFTVVLLVASVFWMVGRLFEPVAPREGTVQSDD